MSQVIGNYIVKFYRLLTFFSHYYLLFLCLQQTLVARCLRLINCYIHVLLYLTTGKPETDTDHYMFIARFKNWGDGPFNWPCFGQRVRYVCVFGVGDLPLLASRPELFANKFYADYQPATLDCMEELHYNRTRAELLGRRTFDSTFYEKLAFVKNHI